MVDLVTVRRPVCLVLARSRASARVGHIRTMGRDDETIAQCDQPPPTPAVCDSMSCVLASSGGDVPAILFWTAAGPVVAAAVGILLFLVAYFLPKGRLLHSMTHPESLAEALSLVPGIDIMHRGRRVKDPYRVTIRLASFGRQDIEFHNAQPIILEVGANIVGILDSKFSKGAPTLEAKAGKTRIMVGPGPAHIIRRDEIMTFTLLLEGPPKGLKCELPFKGIKDASVEMNEPRWIQRVGLALLGNWVLLLFFDTSYLPGGPAISHIRDLLNYSLFLELVIYVPAIVVIKYWQRRFWRAI